tara:strand:- start:220 stop:534 length:315 start_codon:yes stop_codon:yes gene_type:complete
MTLKKYKFRCKTVGERIDVYETKEHIVEVEAIDVETAHDMAKKKYEQLYEDEIDSGEWENEHIESGTDAIEIDVNEETPFFDKYKSIPPNKNVIKKIFKEKGGA